MDYAGMRDGQMAVTIRVRKWHPGWWWFLARTACSVLRNEEPV